MDVNDPDWVEHSKRPKFSQGFALNDPPPGPGELGDPMWEVGRFVRLKDDTAYMWEPGFFRKYVPIIYEKAESFDDLWKEFQEVQDQLETAVEARDRMLEGNKAHQPYINHLQKQADLSVWKLIAAGFIGAAIWQIARFALGAP
jgi:hypothetical protein